MDNEKPQHTHKSLSLSHCCAAQREETRPLVKVLFTRRGNPVRVQSTAESCCFFLLLFLTFNIYHIYSATETASAARASERERERERRARSNGYIIKSNL